MEAPFNDGNPRYANGTMIGTSAAGAEQVFNARTLAFLSNASHIGELGHKTWLGLYWDGRGIYNDCSCQDLSRKLSVKASVMTVCSLYVKLDCKGVRGQQTWQADIYPFWRTIVNILQQ